MRTRKGTITWRDLSLVLLPTLALLAPVFTRRQEAAPAMVIVTEFSDYQCPYCKQAAGVVEQIRQTYGARVKVVIKQMPLSIHEQAFTAARAAVCASQQEKFWEYHDRLFGSNDLSVESLEQMATETGLETQEFTRCFASDESRAQVLRDMNEAERLNVTGTPTFIVNGKAIKGASSFAALKREIDGEFAQLQQPRPTPTNIPEQLRRRRPIDSDPGPVTQSGEYPKAVPTRESQEDAATPTGFPLSLSPSAIKFGAQLVGTTSAQHVETLTNSGTVPLTISEIDVNGGDRLDFSSSYSFSLPVTLAPASHIAINLRFTPSAPWEPGTRDAKLKIKWSGGNQFVALTGTGVTCAGPIPASESGGLCADTDGDGFNDVWEDNGYIDLNNNGRDDDEDFHFPSRRSHIFSPVTRNGDGTSRIFPTVTDPTLPIEASTVVVTVATGGQVGTATFTYTVNGGAPVGPLSIRPVKDIEGNVRLMFYDPGFDPPFVAGDTYTFTTSMGQRTKIADKNVPNIYLQYDYMDWAEPGNACLTDDDCNAGGAELNDVCHQGFCNHNHAPGDPLFRKVVDQFAAHGITLYIEPVHKPVPHAQVITFSKPGDGSLPPGAAAACAGADVVAGNIGPGQFAVNFHDIKYRPGSDFASQPIRKNIYHYTVFSHLNTCVGGDCGNCPIDRSIPGGQPVGGSAGLAELPGNDFIVSLGASLNNRGGSVPTDPFYEGAVFMHELGHNLGLHHDGDVPTPQYAPNYLSVMNYNYVINGIQHAATPGSVIPDEDLRELDYSEHALNTLDENALDENAGVSPLSSGYTGIIIFDNALGDYTLGPEAGPVDWSGNGLIDPGFVSADLNSVGGIGEINKGYADWIHGPCASSTDCRINFIRQVYRFYNDPTLDPHEQCVQNRCQSLWLLFQSTRWGKAD